MNGDEAARSVRVSTGALAGAGRDSRAQLQSGFFDRPTLSVARGLLGQRLVRIEASGRRLSGLITETEAYVGTEDQACHCRNGLTERNAVMWGRPGLAYVYFTYGMHWMLNAVTEAEGQPAAVLIRSLLPLEGVAIMRTRREGKPDHELVNGPAKLCQAFGIEGGTNGVDLTSPESDLTIENGPVLPESLIQRGPRVGIDSVAEPWRSVPWRFTLDLKRLQAIL